MRLNFGSVLVLLLISFASQAATTWKEGQNYFLIQPAQPKWTDTDKVEVTEVFSYGCPACYQFYKTADKLKTSLPATAQMDYMPAAFNPAEDWVMFQQAYCTAKILGVAEKAHDAMFEAVWGTGELGTTDPQTQRLKKNMPTIEDAAKFYNRVAGVKPEVFLATAKSFSVNTMTRRADQLVKAARVPSTPTIIVNGKYRLDVTSAGGLSQLIELVNWLVAKESK